MRLPAALLALAAAAGCGGNGGLPSSAGLVGPASFTAVVPRAFEMSVVWRVARAAVLSPAAPRLRVDARGRPVLLLADVFVPLRHRRDAASAPPFRLGNVGRIDDAAWTSDGTLLVVSDRALGVARSEGFVRIADLPAAGMRVVPAGPGRCWLFGGDGDFARRLYLYDRAGTVAAVARTPDAITAVAGAGDRVYLATGGALLGLKPGEGTSLLFRGDEPIRAVAPAGARGVFFTTARGVFYLREGGVAFRVLDEGADDVQVREEELFLLFGGTAVLRGAPVSSFDEIPGGRS